MEYNQARHGTRLPQVEAEQRLAAEIATLLASDAMTGARVAVSANGYMLTWRKLNVSCTSMTAVRDVLGRWSGQP